VTKRTAACILLGLAVVPSSVGLAAKADDASSCVTFVGDVSLARGVARELHARNQSPWQAMGEGAMTVLAGAWIGNLEGAVSPPSSPRCPRADGLCLGIAAPDLKWLTTAPFRALSLANNHSNDFGPKARAQTAAGLAELGIEAVTAERSPVLLTPMLATRGKEAAPTWALVALNLAGLSADETRLAVEKARLQVGLARAHTPLVAVLPHWGREGSPLPTPQQESVADILAAWGATVVAGNHAHVVQTTACNSTAAIYFGLGNHLFDQAVGAALLGQAVTCCPSPWGATLTCTAHSTARTEASTAPRLLPSDDPPNVCSVSTVTPDRRWLLHPGRDSFLFVQSFPSAGNGAFLVLRRHYSPFDREDALRPYVFRVQQGPEGTRTVDVWRGTALARPLVAARLIRVGGRERLCAIHRGDSFLHPDPQTSARVRLVYRWTGFGFVAADDEEALAICQGL